MVNAIGLMHDISEMPDETIADAFAAIDEEYNRVRMVRDAYIADITRRLEETGGRVLVGGAHEIELVPGTPSYDVMSVRAVAEDVSEDEWARLVKTETKTTEKVDGRVVNSLLKRYGENSRIGQALERARIPGRPRPVVKQKGAA